MPRFAHIPDRRTESGQALVIVLIVSLLLITTLVAALASARAGLAESNGFTAEVQGGMAAQTGLATELTAMRNASTYGALPCDLTGALGMTGATASYTVVVAYSAAGTQLACSPTVGTTLGGVTAPTSATLTATGKAPHGSEAVMKEDVTIAVAASTSPVVGYGIFTASALNLTNGGVTVQGSTGATTLPTEYAEGVVTCDAGVMNKANLITYAPITLTNDCQYMGSLTTDGAETMENSATVAGSAIAYGGGITLSGDAMIGGNATATGGNISIISYGLIGGNAFASGTISETNGPAINQLISGTLSPNDPSLSSETMPAEASFPTLSLPTTQTTPAWSIVNIPASQCAWYFSDSTTPDPFQLALESQTARTVYDASTCSISYGSARTFMLNPPTTGNSTAGDAILDVATMVLTNAGSTFCEESATDSYACSSATTPGPNLTIFANASSASSACSTSTESTTAVQLDNSNNFEQNVVTLIYTLGGVIMQNGNSSMTGQIVACGTIAATNTFTLTVNTAAATEVLGSSSTGASLTLTDEDKYVVSG